MALKSCLLGFFLRKWGKSHKIWFGATTVCMWEWEILMLDNAYVPSWTYYSKRILAYRKIYIFHTNKIKTLSYKIE
jgi:hypothetical protein